MLFIGDIVGEPGRRAVKTLVPRLREKHQLDFVIANGENSAGGSGITPRTASESLAAGVDAITTGDHLWDQKEVMELLTKEPRFLRPLNYPAETPGQGSAVFELGTRNPELGAGSTNSQLSGHYGRRTKVVAAFLRARYGDRNSGGEAASAVSVVRAGGCLDGAA